MAVPPHVVVQSDAKEMAARLFGDIDSELDERLLGVFDHGAVRTRHSCVPLSWFDAEHAFREKNDLYIQHAQEIARVAIEQALERGGLGVEDVDHIVFVSSTGIAAPTIDARLANRMGFRRDVRRTPLWGLGCSGGAAGVGRAFDLALADPDAVILVLALELCSLTFQRHDRSKRNLVAASLFADGAAAALVLGADVPSPANGRRAAGSSNGCRPLELLAAGSTLWPDSLDVMGWEVDGAGLHLVLSRDLPSTVRGWIRPAMDDFLSPHGLGVATVGHVVAHPGGAKVLEGFAEALELPPNRLRHSWDVLRDYGNMSSPTCLFVLDRYLRAGDIGPGETAILAALGAGFSAEYVLMRGVEPEGA